MIGFKRCQLENAPDMSPELLTIIHPDTSSLFMGRLHKKKKKHFQLRVEEIPAWKAKKKNIIIVQMELNTSTTMKERENTHVFGFIPVTTTSVCAVDIAYPDNLWGLFWTISICYLWY